MRLKIEELSIRQKLGMVCCARCLKDEDVEFTIEMIKNHSIGCVQLPAQRPDIVEKIIAAADYPLLVFNDTETGFPTTNLPSITPMSLTACGKREYFEAFAKGIVRDAQAAGFNGTWGPVVDVLWEDGPLKAYRCFGDTAEKVSKNTEIIAEIYKRNNYLSTGKHYPGGFKTEDTHMVEGVCDETKEELIETSLAPYIYLHKKGLLPCIMTEHTVFSSIDPDYPASLSKKVIDIIRDMGFDGVTFTDSFAMMGVLQKFGEENIYGMAVAAGNDIILPNYRTRVKDAYEMLVKNYEDGAFTEERLNEAVRRVLAAQDFVAAKPENPTVFTDEDEALLKNVAKDCITGVTDEGVGTALDNPQSKERLFIVLTQNQFNPDTDSMEIETGHWYHPEILAEKIREEFPNAGLEFLPEDATHLDNARVLVAATNYKEVVFVTFCYTNTYLGTDCFSKRTEVLMNCLIRSGKVSTVVHFGNPNAVKTIDHVPRKIFGYMMKDSQKYAIDVLKGTLEAKGVLPYNID